MFSIITPLDIGRFEQFKKTKMAYDEMEPEKEFIIPTRYHDKVAKFIEDNELSKNVRLIPYVHDVGFNASKALNLGVSKAKYDQVIITSPEVLPQTPVLDQFSLLLGTNVIAQVFDQEEDGSTGISLVNKHFRSDTPAMYFLGLFNKEDIMKINGWDENFMNGYAYEDNDFGDRWVRAGLPFEVREEIKGLHQYHPRIETVAGGSGINYNLYQDNNANGVIVCENGIIKPTGANSN
jgi:predicted glycosyltransferase involved in capsule biosynthesis